MTAINGIADSAAAYLCTDSVSYNLDDGIVTGFVCKAVALPQFSMAFAVTGSLAAEAEIIRKLKFKSFSSFDDIVLGAAECLRDAWEVGEFDFFGADEHLNNFRIIIAGWSDQRKRGELYALSTMDEMENGAFTLVNRNVFVSPGVGEEEARRIGLTSASVDPVDSLTALIDFRRMLRPNPKCRTMPRLLTCFNFCDLQRTTLTPTSAMA
jgi:hypothetical protein